MSEPNRRRPWLRSLYALLSTVALGCGGRMAESTPTDDAGTLRREDFIPRLVKAICASADECCTLAGWVPSTDCREAVQSHWQPIIDHADDVGAAFDSDQALFCLAHIKGEWSECRGAKEFTSTSDAVCGRVFSAPSPRSALGEPCVAAMDCLQNRNSSVVCFRIGEDAGVTGICLGNQTGGLDSPCGGALGSEYANCSAPAVCGEDLRCQARYSLGRSCSSLGGDTCEIGSVCDVGGTNLCRSAVTLGEPCGSKYDCENFACLGGRCRVYPDLALSWYCKERLPGSP